MEDPSLWGNTANYESNISDDIFNVISSWRFNAGPGGVSHTHAKSEELLLTEQWMAASGELKNRTCSCLQKSVALNEDWCLVRKESKERRKRDIDLRKCLTAAAFAEKAPPQLQKLASMRHIEIWKNTQTTLLSVVGIIMWMQLQLLRVRDF